MILSTRTTIILWVHYYCAQVFLLHLWWPHLWSLKLRPVEILLCMSVWIWWETDRKRSLLNWLQSLDQLKVWWKIHACQRMPNTAIGFCVISCMLLIAYIYYFCRRGRFSWNIKYSSLSSWFWVPTRVCSLSCHWWWYHRGRRELYNFSIFPITEY